MNTSILRRFATVLSLGIAAQAWAGNGSERGGGLVFLCSDGIYLADTYPLFFGKEIRPFPDEMIEELKISDTMLKLMETDHPGLRKKIKAAWDQLEWQSSGALPLLGDDHLGKIPPQCIDGRKAQIVVQTIASGQIAYDSALYYRLSDAEKLVLDFHEALVRLSHQGAIPGIDLAQGTVPVRRMVLRYLLQAIVIQIRSKLHYFGAQERSEMNTMTQIWAIWALLLESAPVEASVWPSLRNQPIADPSSTTFQWAKKALRIRYGIQLNDEELSRLVQQARDAFKRSTSPRAK